MKLLPVILLLFLQLASPAQNKGIINGRVLSSIDSSGLPAATVTVFKKADSAAINYQVTGEQGLFEIKELPLKTPLYISVSHTGFVSHIADLYLDSAKSGLNLRTISLVRDTGQVLEEVIVKTIAPVTLNGDTLEINPAGIRLDSTEVAEEILLRTPGVARWQDSTITVNGKKVKKLYVDGKPFFDGSFNMALKNLPKHAIDKIQVYQERDFYKQKIEDMQKDTAVVMNIKLKPDKRKGHFGNTTARAGTNKSYGADMSMQVYNKGSNLGFNATVSNTRKALGNIEPVLQNKDLNIQNNWNTGVDYRKNLKEVTDFYNEKSLTGQYLITGDRNSSVNNRTTVRNLGNTKFTDLNNGYSLSRSLSQSLRGAYNSRKKERSFSTNVSYRRTHSSSETEGTGISYRNDSIPASRSSNRSQADSYRNDLNLSGNYSNTSINEDPGPKNFSANYAIGYGTTLSNSNTYSRFDALTDSIYTDLYDRKYVNRNSNLNGNLGLNYGGLRQLLLKDHNFWNINMGLNNNTQYSGSEINADVADRDTVTHTYNRNNNLSNLSSTTNINNRTGLQLAKTFTKNITDRFRRTIQISTNLQNQLLYQRNVSTLSYRNRTFIYNFFTPASGISYNYYKTEGANINMNLTHNSSATAPTIDQLYPIQDSAANRYRMIVGNPNLKSRFNNVYNFSFAYNKNGGFERKNSYNAALNLGYNKERNGISDSTIYDGNGGTTTYFINTPGSKMFNTGFNAGLSLMFNKTTIQANTSGGYATGSVYYAAGAGVSNSFNGGTNLNISHPVRKNIYQLSYNGNWGSARGPQYIDGDLLTYKNDRLNHNITLSFNAPGIIDVSIQQSISKTNAEQHGDRSAYTPTRTQSYNTAARFTLKVPKNFTLSNSFRYNKNISVNQQPIRNINWDAFAGYVFPKKKKMFETRVSVFNILGQNQTVNSYSSGSTTTTTVSQGLQRYFQFTLSYFPRQFGGRAKRAG
ncbi:porin family protein [Niabella drilacis]|uniref:Outer membrane protein beta-barrel family protein n=1 Tax=Niabella drilacis (strain DSM 25811 / CCM 8410 / CCUG 62505 / LMG 26954 / E90) TaxID=1285928 RepID=A0A1G6L266_NIADE|nr:outer membrane beta-barrel protein [Niabella drilacis]SDC37440.1 Outer membrane protein beta-barrel family protein [Niabella drilacis]